MTSRRHHAARAHRLLALASLLACACSDDGHEYDPSRYAAFEEGLAPEWADLPYDSIQLERQPCFGTCPVYTFQLFRSLSPEAPGRAEYEGIDYAEREGTFEGEVDRFDYARLCQLLEYFGFEDFEPSYTGNWTDDSTVIVTVRRPGSEHTVSDYGRQGPPELQALQLAIDAVAEKIEWEAAR
jgi:hypothetical protein